MKKVNVILLALAAFAIPNVVCARHNQETRANAPPSGLVVVDDVCINETVINFTERFTITNIEPLELYSLGSACSVIHEITNPKQLIKPLNAYKYAFELKINWPDSKRYTYRKSQANAAYKRFPLKDYNYNYVVNINWPDSKRYICKA